MDSHSEPSSIRGLVACTKCKLVKTEAQFNQDNCDNCGNDCETTKKFSGIICMMEPKASWVARWSQMQGKKPGAYAVDVKRYGEEVDEGDDGGDFMDSDN